MCNGFEITCSAVYEKVYFYFINIVHLQIHCRRSLRTKVMSVCDRCVEGPPDYSFIILAILKSIEKIKCSTRYQAAVREVVDWLRECTFNPSSCCLRIKIIYRMLIECFVRCINNSHLVALVLQCAVNHNFDVHDIIRITQLISRRHEPNALEEKKGQGRHSHCVLTYYLHHANEDRLLFGSRRRYVSVAWQEIVNSVSLSMIECENIPPEFLTLIQHGACLSEERRLSDHGIPISVVKVLHKLIQYGGNLKYWDKNTLLLLVDLSDMHDTVKELCSIFTTLLKDTVNPHEVTYCLAGQNIDGMQIPYLETVVPFYDELFPHCRYSRRQPASLSHMCRYVIRNRLYDNWKLPEGIQNLPIPEILKRHLNLLDNYSFRY